MKFRSTVLYFCGTILLTACGQSQQERIDTAVKAHMDAKKKAAQNNAVTYKRLQKAAWLLGSWKGVIGQGVSAEHWYKQDDSTFAGAGAFVKGNVTLSQEQLQLAQKGDEIFYIATVKGQNEDKPVRFKMTTLTDKLIIVENPQHDFPQKIKYTLYKSDSLVAEISGRVNGAVRTEMFPMKRSH